MQINIIHLNTNVIVTRIFISSCLCITTCTILSNYCSYPWFSQEMWTVLSKPITNSHYYASFLTFNSYHIFYGQSSFGCCWQNNWEVSHIRMVNWNWTSPPTTIFNCSLTCSKQFSHTNLVVLNTLPTNKTQLNSRENKSYSSWSLTIIILNNNSIIRRIIQCNIHYKQSNWVPNTCSFRIIPWPFLSSYKEVINNLPIYYIVCIK